MLYADKSSWKVNRLPFLCWLNKSFIAEPNVSLVKQKAYLSIRHSLLI